MNKEKLIQSCNIIIQEIEEWNTTRGSGFYICNYSKVDDVCDDIVPLLSKFGKTYIENFGHIYAFTYENDTLFNEEYNKAKIKHIKSFINYVVEGGSIELID